LEADVPNNEEPLYEVIDVKKDIKKEGTHYVAVHKIKAELEKHLRWIDVIVLFVLVFFCLVLVSITNSTEEAIKILTVALPAFTFVLGRTTKGDK
jgi:hypothetical protein